AMKRGAEKLGMTLPDSKAAVNSNADISGAASIGKLSVLKTTEYSAQELHDMLSKQLDKPGTSPEMREKIQIALGKADTAINSDIHTKMVGHGVNKLKNIISADILKEHRRNEIGGGTVLDSDIVTELEKSSNSLSS
ncbi:hypothetical protein, partial [Klebsiella variicola]|uniref:hypothetical protein n=2 Tax=Enterobacterales TaxID=91347 RepID=UPI002B052BEF